MAWVRSHRLILALLVSSGLMGFCSILPAQDGPQIDLTNTEREWLAEHPGLRLAPAPNYPPIEFFDDNGEYRGIAADYVALLESKLGIRFEILRYDAWNDVVEATKNHEIDVWMEAADTPERREFLNILKPYLNLPAVIITQKKTVGELSLSDLVGLRVAVPEGYATQRFIEERQPDLDLLLVPSIADGLERVSLGSADALVANIAVASFYIEQLGLSNLRVAGESGWIWELSIASRKDWPVLSGILQKGLDSISTDERRKILRKWVAIETEETGFSRLETMLGLLVVVLAALLVTQFFRHSQESVSGDLSQAIVKRSWPIMVAAITVIAVIIIGYFWSQSILEERARRDVQNAIQTVLNTTGQAVIAWFRAREQEVQFWASLKQLRDATLKLIDTPRDDVVAHTAALESFHATVDTLMAGKSYEGFTLMALDGTTLTSGPEQPERTDDAWDIENLDGLGFDQDILSTGLAGTAGKSSTLAFPPKFIENILSSPTHVKLSLPEVFSGLFLESIVVGTGIADDTGEVRAILAFHIDPQQEYSEIMQRGRIGESGETYAINRHGQLISESRFDEDLMRIGLIEETERSILNIDIRDPGVNLTRGEQSALPRREQPLTLMARNATAKESAHDMLGYNDYRGVPVVGAWLWDDSYALGITTEMDVAEAYASFANYQQQARIATVLTIFLILALTTMFIRTRIRMAAAGAKLEEAYAIIKLHSDRMEEELNVGREIQMSMIPLIFPAFPDSPEFVVHAQLEPAREVGGDFYDFYFIDEDHFCVCIGDVSGKGVPAALFMAVAKTLIKSRASDDTSTASIIIHVNNEVSSDNPSSMFVTIFVAIINIKTGEIVFTNAGHNPPYIKLNDGGLEQLGERHGPVVGAMPRIDYKEGTRSMQPGDVLILYTDGVTEAMDSDRNLFEDERLHNLLASNNIQSAEDVPREIMKAVTIFEGGTDQTDDCTILAFQYNGPVAKSDDEIWTMTIKNRLSEIPEVIDGIEKFCQELPVPLSPGRKLKIVLDEILNNTISYGYDDEQEQEIRIEVEPIADGIILTIRDSGNAFNPLERETPDTDLSIDDRSPGGLGLHLVKNMVDDVHYVRVDETNVLSLTLYFDRQTNEADTSGSSSAD